METTYYYAAGYVYSVIAGTFFTYYLADYTGKAIGEFKDGVEYNRWVAYMVGAVERILYTSVVFLDRWEFIGVWLALKAISQWGRWNFKEEDTRIPNPKKERKKMVNIERYQTRANFNSYLINTGMSIAYGVLGGLISLWLMRGYCGLAVMAGGGLILFNLGFIWLAQYKYYQR